MGRVRCRVRLSGHCITHLKTEPCIFILNISFLQNIMLILNFEFTTEISNMPINKLEKWKKY